MGLRHPCRRQKLAAMKRACQQSGFTLFELMITIGLGAVLIGLAAPSIANFTRASRIAASSRDLVTDFAFARNEAVMRAQRVSVCTSANLTSCANSSWGQGRLVFVDGGTAGTIDGTDLVLLRPPVLDSSIVTSSLGIATSHFVSFLPNGRLTGTGLVSLCSPNQKLRRVALQRTGQAGLTRTTIAC